MNDISTKLEVFLIDRIGSQLPGMVFYGTKGDDVIEPPFCVISVENSEEMIRASNIYTCVGVFQLITQIDDTTSAEHADLLSRIKPAFDTLGAACPIHDTDLDIAVFGIDLGKFETRESMADLAHADLFTFTIGAQG